jgi:ATP-dependent Lon protease
MHDDSEIKEDRRIPLLPLKDVVIFPHMVIPLFVGRTSSIAAVDNALSSDRLVLTVCQRDPLIEDPNGHDLYKMGTVTQIIRMLKQSDGKVKILVQGMYRARVKDLEQANEGYVSALAEHASSVKPVDEFLIEARMRSIIEQLIKLVSMGKPVLPDFLEMLDSLKDPDILADILSSNLNLPTSDVQKLLEDLDPLSRLGKLAEYFNRELSIQEVQQKITDSTKGEIDKNQRNYYLREQLKAIQKELGDYGADVSEM